MKTDTERAACPSCGHARHDGEICLNMASDNECNCDGIEHRPMTRDDTSADELARLLAMINDPITDEDCLTAARTMSSIHRTENNRFAKWGKEMVEYCRTRELLPALARLDAAQHALKTVDRSVCQILGRALGYPAFVDDPKNFPNAKESDGVCTADHCAETIAHEAAERLDAAQREVAELRALLSQVYGMATRRHVNDDGSNLPWDCVLCGETGSDSKEESLIHDEGFCPVPKIGAVLAKEAANGRD